MIAFFCLVLRKKLAIAWLKYQNSLATPRLYPTLCTLIAMLISFLLLAQSLKTLPIGTAYTVWTGIGAVGRVLYGLYFLWGARECNADQLYGAYYCSHNWIKA